MKHIYWTYRMVYTNTWVRYTPSYFLDKQYEDYLKAGLTKTLDMEIPEDRYTAEIVPWIKKMNRFIIGEYNEAYVNPVDYEANIKSVWAQFQIETFATVEEARQWIRDNTDLVEKETPWVFVIHWENEWIDGEIVPEKLLDIS